MASSALTTLDFSQQALAFIGEIVPEIVATAALVDQRLQQDGTLIDVVDVSWRIVGRPGTLQSWVPAVTDWNYSAIGAIQYDYAVVMAIYEGQPNQDQIVQLPPPPGPAPAAGPAVAA